MPCAVCRALCAVCRALCAVCMLCAVCCVPCAMCCVPFAVCRVPCVMCDVCIIILSRVQIMKEEQHSVSITNSKSGRKNSENPQAYWARTSFGREFCGRHLVCLGMPACLGVPM